MAMTLDEALAIIKSRQTAGASLTPEQQQKMAEDLIRRREGLFEATPGGAARFRPAGVAQPRETEAKREEEALSRGITLLGAVSAPLAGVTGLTMKNVLASGAPEYGGHVLGQAVNTIKPAAAGVAAALPAASELLLSQMGHPGGKALGPMEYDIDTLRKQMLRRNIAPPSAEEFADTKVAANNAVPSILDEEAKKQAAAVNPAQPMMPPANAIGLNTDADIAEIRARVRQMEGRELPQFKTPNAEADLTDRMKNIKVPTRPGLSDLSDDDKSSALLRMGLGMMGGTSPYFAQNFAAGGTAGLDAAEKSRDTMMKDLMTKYGIDADMAMKLVTARSQDTAGANANIAALYNQLNDRDKNALSGMSKVLELRTAADKVKADDAYHTRHLGVMEKHYKNLADQMKGKSAAAKAEALRDELALITRLKNNTGNPQDVQLGTMLERVLHASMPAGEQKLQLPTDANEKFMLESQGAGPLSADVISKWKRGFFDGAPGDFAKALKLARESDLAAAKK